MHIVNLISGKDLGGPKQAFVHYSDNLRHLGQQVTSVIRPGAQVQGLLDQRQLYYRFLDYPRTRLPGLKHIAQSRLKKLLTDTQADVLLVHKPIDAALARPVLPAGCKLVLVLHSYTAKGMHAADVILPVSKPVEDFVRQQGFQGPTLIMPNLVELDEQEPQSRPKSQPLSIMQMGVMRRTKGQDLLIEALAKLHKGGNDFHLNLAGKGRWFKKINKLIESHNLRAKVSMRNWVSNAERDNYVDACDVFCLTSRSETFGMVVIEAMARKRLVLATRCGGPEGIIEHGVNGLLADINADAIAAQLQVLDEMNDEQYQAMCEAAYQHVVDNYSTQPFRQRLAQLLNLLA